MMKVTDEIRKRWSTSSRISVTAIQPANATAACPDGRPPRNGVPLPVSAFVAITTIVVSTSAIKRQLGRDGREPVEQPRAAVGDLAREDEVADRDGDGGRDQHGAGGDVLRQLRHRVERGRRDVDRRLDGRVQHLRDQDERDREQQRDQLQLVDAGDERRDQHEHRDGEVDPHVPLRAEHVDDPLEGEVERLDDRGRTPRSSCRALPRSRPSAPRSAPARRARGRDRPSRSTSSGRLENRRPEHSSTVPENVHASEARKTTAGETCSGSSSPGSTSRRSMRVAAAGEIALAADSVLAHPRRPRRASVRSGPSCRPSGRRGPGRVSATDIARPEVVKTKRP